MPPVSSGDDMSSTSSNISRTDSSDSLSSTSSSGTNTPSRIVDNDNNNGNGNASGTGSNNDPFGSNSDEVFENLTSSRCPIGGSTKASNLLMRVLSSGGRNAPRVRDEAAGKKLVVGEVRLDHCFPGGARSGWLYKISVNGERLPPKAVPKWMVWMEMAPRNPITLEVLARDTSVPATTTTNGLHNGVETAVDGKSEDFISIKAKPMKPLDFFKVAGDDVAAGRAPIDWERCPGMEVVLEMRLEADATRGGAGAMYGSGKVSTRSLDVRQKVEVLSQRESSQRRAVMFPPDGTASVIPAPPPLTAVEIVIVKDSYNKVLSWAESLLEFMVERLFFFVPSLPETLGDLAPNLQRYLHGMIDLAVRALDPSTEDISRETYQALHPNPNQAHQDVQGYAQALAEQGFLLTHWEVLRELWMDALKISPYMEAYELHNMKLGVESAAYRFFTLHVLTPAVRAINDMDKVYEDTANATKIAKSWLPYSVNENLRWGLAVEVYGRLFTRHPEVVRLFRRADMYSLSKLLSDLLQIAAMSFGDMWANMLTIRELGAAHADLGLPTSAHAKLSEVLMEVLGEKLEGFCPPPTATAFPGFGFAVTGGAVVEEEGLSLKELWGLAWQRAVTQVRLPMDNAERLIAKAYEWTEQASFELHWDEGYTKTRKGAIYNEVVNRGTYTHTFEELVHGARVCWRNSAKCIGRIAWNTLMVRDKRHVTDLDEVFAECMEHQRLAMADGRPGRTAPQVKNQAGVYICPQHASKQVLLLLSRRTSSSDFGGAL
eukprot:jgi/Undpi1/190/HiC_scaffold_1.g00187.m1